MPTYQINKNKKQQPIFNIHANQGECLEIQPEPAICFAPVVLAHFPQHLFCRSSLGAYKVVGSTFTLTPQMCTTATLRNHEAPGGVGSSVPCKSVWLKAPNVVSSCHSNLVSYYDNSCMPAQAGIPSRSMFPAWRSGR